MHLSECLFPIEVLERIFFVCFTDFLLLSALKRFKKQKNEILPPTIVVEQALNSIRELILTHICYDLLHEAKYFQ